MKVNVYRYLILHVVGVKLGLRVREKPDIEDHQEHMKKMSAPERKREEVTAGQIGLHNREICNVYFLVDQIREDELGSVCSKLESY
jgi:hypothetical protein